MNTVNERYDQLIDKITLLAQTREDIRAVIILGSRARKNMPADDWSDLDISIITSTPDFYIDNESWMGDISTYWLTFVENTAMGGGKERRVLFENGLDVDFAIMPLEIIEQMRIHGIPEDARYSLGRGIKIIIDKDGILDRLFTVDLKLETPHPPSEKEYMNLVNDFIYHFVWTLKKLKRNEIWTAKGCSDNYMKWQLLRMAEWHARALNGNSYDTWHAGRFIEKWADPRLVAGFKKAFAHFDAEDIRESLKETYNVFRMMALEVADKLCFTYPAENEEKVLKWAEDNLM
jgi:aminoglycoside 6-adenylyltransferase